MSKVFIGMPVYNGERFLREAIESLQKQSYTDWTLFISDDVSKDKTESIIAEYTKNDSRIKYRKQSKNLGMFANFKFTLDKADGEYFMWAAQDDVWEKDFIKVCIENLEKKPTSGLATTCNETIDSFGRKVLESPWMKNLSGKPGHYQVAKFVLEPEGMGKCNLMYGLFRIGTLRKTWDAYPQRNVWGQDYMFSLAAISRFEVIIDPKILFKKRLGGYSSPQLELKSEKDEIGKLGDKNIKNQMFPFGRFGTYFSGHMEALRGTPYQLIASIMLLSRLPRALFVHIKERSFKNFFKRMLKKTKSPIIVKLNGGLCNQIFQYAFARSLSLKLNRDFRLDTTAFGRYYRFDPYGLWKFNIQEKIAKDSDMKGFVWFRKHNTVFSFIYHRLRLKKLISSWYYVEKTFAYDESVISSGATYYEGFWQSEKYFKHIADDLRKEITTKEPLSVHSQEIIKKIQNTNAVSLHVRRYAHEDKSPWHGFCSKEYYIEAIKRITERYPSPHFFIFSDNYPWVMENFLPVLKSMNHPFTLVENDNDKNAEDVVLMSKCQHHIVANSSFSWWGAWLNPSKNKIVIAPKKWFANAPKNNTSDLIPKEWITIDV